ncbi:MAG: hypothetical protein J0H01_11985 [Rhizobiales bacterium]|nr:hypothetical protein [Hyphomicrobiales bacterium]
MLPRDVIHRLKDLALTGLAFALVLYAVVAGRPDMPAGPEAGGKAPHVAAAAAGTIR